MKKICVVLTLVIFMAVNTAQAVDGIFGPGQDDLSVSYILTPPYSDILSSLSKGELPKEFLVIHAGAVNIQGYGTPYGGGSDACMGGACFSWFCTNYRDQNSCLYTQVKIPVSISDFRETANTFSKEIKKSKSIRISAEQIADTIEKVSSMVLERKDH